MRASPKAPTQTSPSRKGAVILLALCLVLGVGAALSRVWTRLQVIDYGYRISKASREQARLREINRKLHIELTLLKNPDRIKRIAEERLGMVLPLPSQVRRLPAAAVKSGKERRISRLAPGSAGAQATGDHHGG